MQSGGKKCATAGNRTRIHCLEGNDANHYTTDAGDNIISLCHFQLENTVAKG